MRNVLFFLLLIIPIISNGQSKENSDQNQFNQYLKNLTGSLESNAQWYINDKTLGEFTEDEHVRANSYLRLDYNFLNNFTVGLQVESYEPIHLINFYSGYDQTNLATYYANFKNETLDITAGYFYEQFGSGLLLRAYEERQLGINNAIRGGRIKYSPASFIDFTALYGQNRIAFEVSDGKIFGFDTNIDLSDAFKVNGINSFNIGLSYVGKQEDLVAQVDTFDTNGFPEMINSFTARLDIDLGKFYLNTEYSIKGEDVAYTPPSLGLPEIIEGNYFRGNALLMTAGYTKKGIGISGTFRRMENMAFFSEREFAIPGGNQFIMSSINFWPALTKQQDYSLANIYIYQPQPFLFLQDFAGQAGEIGGQFDLFYNFKKGSAFGGKYGTKFSANFSYWSLIDAEFDQTESTYSANFLKFGKKLNRDFNFEIRKKLSQSWRGILTYINTIVDKGVSLGGPLGVQGNINSDIVIADVTHKIGSGKSIRLEGQHLWTKDDMKNWVGGTLEYNASSNMSFYVTDIYNYGNDVKDDQLHYYNLGGSYTKGATRLALNFGRQRGGLICVGGVCRFVPENTGFTLNLSTAF
ncbi:MAG: hypothetical protein HKO81_06420 [Flavobacteriaceae bacterium]|nr:hypothetical protein [Flavobacteriaceae bacterium]